MKIRKKTEACTAYKIKLLSGKQAAEFESFMLNEVIPALPLGILTRVGTVTCVRLLKTIGRTNAVEYLYFVYGGLVGNFAINRIESSDKFKTKITELGDFDEIVSVKKKVPSN